MPRSGRSGRAANFAGETTAHSEYGALPLRIVIHRSACSFAVQRSCRPRTRMRTAIGLCLWTGQIADSTRLSSVRLARVGRPQIRQIVAALSLTRPDWCAARDGQLWGWLGVCRPPVNRTLAPPEEANVPGMSLTGGWTLQADEGNPDRGHDGNCRCDTHWCRDGCPCISGDHLCGGGGLVYPGFPLNVGTQLARGGARRRDAGSPARQMVMARLPRLAVTRRPLPVRTCPRITPRP